jgi:hypothetical protein
MVVIPHEKARQPSPRDGTKNARELDSLRAQFNRLPNH